MTRIRAFLLPVLLFAGVPNAAANATYLATTPNGTRIGPLPFSSGQATLRVGSTVQIAVDGTTCSCTAILTELRVGGTSTTPNVALPTNVTSGPDEDVRGAGLVKLRVKVSTKSADGKTTTDTFEELMIRFTEDTWWAIADTVAYAVTRQSGNTPIAGAGIFISAPRWKVLRRLDWIQYAFAVHLLPPAEKGAAADLGVSPIGIALFDGRFVAGAGWDISRNGERPDSHNRYVYLGFSASRLLSPKLPEQ